jgi:SAM-dependent methyltransferase
MEQAVADAASQHPATPLRALLLGMTPDIARMHWPPLAHLTAADSSLGMVKAVWPGNIAGRREAVCANWLSLPLKPSSCDVVLGDGSANCVPYPDGFRALRDSVHQVLREGGVFVLRCFTRPAPGEHPDDILSCLAGGGIPSFHHVKFRLLMAVQESTEAGVAVDDVYQWWARKQIDTVALCARTGWDRHSVEMMELYRGSNTVHTFPTLEEVHSVLDESFDEVSTSIPSYHLSERCPIFVLRSKPRRAPVEAVR